MKKIIQSSLKTAKSYAEYKRMVLELIREGKSTGEIQNETLFNFSKLNNQRMKRLDKQAQLSQGTVNKTREIEKDFTWLVLTESWCGDAAQTLPILNKFAESNEKIDFKVVLRDENEELMNRFLTNGSKSIPKLIVIDNSSQKVLKTWGPRTEKAAKMVYDYKKQHGKIDETLKTELQKWYNQDKGSQIEKEMIEIINEMI